MLVKYRDETGYAPLWSELIAAKEKAEREVTTVAENVFAIQGELIAAKEKAEREATRQRQRQHSDSKGERR